MGAAQARTAPGWLIRWLAWQVLQADKPVSGTGHYDDRLWLPYALGSGQAGFALAVAAFGLVCLRNYRLTREHAGFFPRLRRNWR